MSYTVSATDLEKLRFNETDTVNSVLQNIAVILSTPKEAFRYTATLDWICLSWTSLSQ